MIKFIVNPVAGGGTALKKWNAVRHLFSDYDVSFTEYRRHALEIATASLGDYDLIVAVGGDGTLYETLNGFFKDGNIINPRPALGFLPFGRANDFAVMAKIPMEAPKAAQALIDGRDRMIDVGMSEAQGKKEVFLINLAVGFESDAAMRAQRGKFITSGELRYFLLIFETLWGYKNQPMRINYDGHEVSGRYFIADVFNGHLTGGGMVLVPDAKIDDGALDVFLAEDLSKLDAVKLLPQTYSGKRLVHPKILISQAKKVTIEPDTPMYIVNDGETVGLTPVTVSVLPRVLKMRMPP
jgi:YegS/Rv2252/BmrU family lipid kinase